MQEGKLEGIYMRTYTPYHVQTKPERKKKVAGKREVRIIAYTSKHKKQRATPSRIEEETLIRPFLSLCLSQMKCDATQRMKK